MYLKKILVAVLLLGVLAMAIFAWFVYKNVFLPNTAFNNNEAHLYIRSDADFKEVLSELEPLIVDIGSFETVARKKGYDRNVKPGHYIIENGMNNNEIVNTIRSKNIPILVKFNNQERIENLAASLSRQLEPDSLAMINAMTDSLFLATNNFNLENTLAMYIPNSYEFYWNTKPEEITNRMLDEYNNFWTQNRLDKAESLKMSPQEIISLAAIVQKETAKAEERPRVAGVYINRLKRGMPLQADPTVIYAKKLTENDFDQVIKRVLYRDLEIDSKYNTYKYTGVPPGPIAMPDISSIESVLNYEEHNYLFFVADVTNFGYHKFATTLSQHNQNKAKYVQWVNAQGVNR